MQPLIADVHLITGLTALTCGLVVFLRAKGTRSHRVIGYGYVASMLALNVTAFLIYRLYGRFGPFHVAALVSLATVVAGMIPVLLRRPKQRWLSLHYGFMCWSYVGLLAATVAEIAVRVPWVRPRSPGMFLALVLGATLVVMVGGGWMINRMERRTVSSVGGTTGGDNGDGVRC